MVTISRSILESNGYKCWKEYPEPHIVAQYQKCISDDLGKKYFININETTGWNPALSNDVSKHNFWPSVQFNININDSFHSINIQLVQWFNESGKYSNISIKQMEDKIEEIFISLNGQHYD